MKYFEDGHVASEHSAYCPIEEAGIACSYPAMEICPLCRKDMTKVPYAKKRPISEAEKAVSAHCHAG